MKRFNHLEKIGIVSILLFVLILSISSVSAAQIHEVHSDKGETIADAVNMAVDGDIVELNGTFYESSISISSKITIKSFDADNKAILDGNGLSNRLFTVSSKNYVTFENLIIKNYSYSDGPAIYFNSGNELPNQIINCTFIDCTFTGANGGIVSNRGILIINGTSFENCISNAVYNYGGQCIVDNSIFKNGGIQATSASSSLLGRLEVYNSIFENNTKNPALFTTGSRDTVFIVENSIFMNNSIAITLNTGGTNKAMGSYFADNDLVFYHNHARGIFNISYSRFVDNIDIVENNRDGIFILDFNWWGSNVLPDLGDTVVNNYFVVDFLNSSGFVVGENVIFDYVLRLNDSSDFDDSKLPVFYGNYNDTELNSGSVLFSDNGFVYTVLLSSGDYALDFVMDNEIFNIAFVLDYALLNELISNITGNISNNDLNESHYTIDSWNYLQEALVNATDLSNDNAKTQEEIDEMFNVLKSAVSDLIFDYSNLENFVNDVKNLNQSRYNTSDTFWDDLVTAMNNAEDMLVSRDAVDWDDIESLVSALESAIDNLNFNYSILQSIFDEVKDLNISHYDEISGATLESARDNAEDMLTLENANDWDDIESLVSALESAIDNLNFNYSSLQAIVDIVNDLEESDYTSDSWGVLESAMIDAEDMLVSRDAVSWDYIESLVSALESVKDNLELDYSDLENLLDETDDLVESEYSPESWAILQEAIGNATDLISSGANDADEIRDQISELQLAIDSLEFIPNYSGLDDLVNSVDGLVESEYSPESWAVLQDVINSAKTMSTDDTANNQNEIRDQISLLQSAINGLTKVKVKNETNGVKNNTSVNQGNVNYPVVSAGSSKVKTVLILSAPTIYKGKYTNIRALLKDSTGKLLVNEKVQITINGRTYTAFTNSKGIATFKIKGGKVGKFGVVAKYLGNGSYLSSSTNKTQTIKGIADLKITGVKKVGNNYRITVKNQGSASSKLTKLHILCGCKSFVKAYYVKALSMGKSTVVTVKFSNRVASHVKFAVVNSYKNVLESNYKNNVYRIGKI